MDEIDSELVHLFSSPSGVFYESEAVDQLAARLKEQSDSYAAIRQNFILDNSFHQADVIVSDNSVMKAGVGWITVAVTEPIKSGVHEWGIRIENQGETTDGSGLMLGIIPKGFSKNDSFISQGGGWCISRAGKFYGNWRRIDGTSPVGGVVFGNDDLVHMELDMDNGRMTVRVADRHVVGELNNFNGCEVFPAVSLHYRNQHVKFEYHRECDKNAKSRSWIERNVLPTAMSVLPLQPKHLDIVPFDIPVINALNQLNREAANNKAKGVSSSSAAASGSTSTAEDSLPPGQVELLSTRLSVSLRALEALSRYVKTGQLQPSGMLADTLPIEWVQKQLAVSHIRNHSPGNQLVVALSQAGPGGARGAAAATASSGGSASSDFASNCSSLFLVHLMTHLSTIDAASGLDDGMPALPPSATSATLPSSSSSSEERESLLDAAITSISDMLREMQPFSLAEGSATSGIGGLNSKVLDQAQQALMNFCEVQFSKRSATRRTPTPPTEAASSAPRTPLTPQKEASGAVESITTTTVSSPTVTPSAASSNARLAKALEALVLLTLHRAKVGHILSVGRLLQQWQPLNPPSSSSPTELQFPPLQISGDLMTWIRQGFVSSESNWSTNLISTKMSDQSTEVKMESQNTLLVQTALSVASDISGEYVFIHHLDGLSRIHVDTRKPSVTITTHEPKLFLHTADWSSLAVVTNLVTGCASSFKTTSSSSAFTVLLHTETLVNANIALLAFSFDLHLIGQFLLPGSDPDSTTGSPLTGMPSLQFTEVLSWWPSAPSTTSNSAAASTAAAAAAAQAPSPAAAPGTNGGVSMIAGASSEHVAGDATTTTSTAALAVKIVGNCRDRLWVIYSDMTMADTAGSPVPPFGGSRCAPLMVCELDTEKTLAPLSSSSAAGSATATPPPPPAAAVGADGQLLDDVPSPTSTTMASAVPTTTTQSKMVRMRGMPPMRGGSNTATSTTTPESVADYSHSRDQIGGQSGEYALQICKEAVVDFGPPTDVLSTPAGHVTVELWLQLNSKEDAKTIYQHGDRTVSGEVFLESHLVEGVLHIRGGARHDGRGVKQCAVSFPAPVGSAPTWFHLALVFDGRWRLFINAEQVGISKAGGTQIPVERPRSKWTLGSGAIGLYRELRLWKEARSVTLIQRDCGRTMAGTEPGLALYCPLDEPSGNVVRDYSVNRRHGWVTRVPEAVRVRNHNCPVSSSAASGWSGRGGGGDTSSISTRAPASAISHRQNSNHHARRSHPGRKFPLVEDGHFYCLGGAVIGATYDSIAVDTTQAVSTRKTNIVLSLFSADTGFLVAEPFVLQGGMGPLLTASFPSTSSSASSSLGSSPANTRDDNITTTSTSSLRDVKANAARKNSVLFGIQDKTLLKAPFPTYPEVPASLARHLYPREDDGSSSSPDGSAFMGQPAADQCNVLGQMLVGLCQVAAIAEPENVPILFSPLSLDVSKSTFQTLSQLLWENFRVQGPGVGSRRVRSIRKDTNRNVVIAVMHALQLQLRTAQRLRLHPASIGLEVGSPNATGVVRQGGSPPPPEGSTTAATTTAPTTSPQLSSSKHAAGATVVTPSRTPSSLSKKAAMSFANPGESIYAFLIELLRDESGTLDAELQLLALDSLSAAISLLFPSLSHRSRMLSDLLRHITTTRTLNFDDDEDDVKVDTEKASSPTKLTHGVSSPVGTKRGSSSSTTTRRRESDAHHHGGGSSSKSLNTMSGFDQCLLHGLFHSFSSVETLSGVLTPTEKNGTGGGETNTAINSADNLGEMSLLLLAFVRNQVLSSSIGNYTQTATSSATPVSSSLALGALKTLRICQLLLFSQCFGSSAGGPQGSSDASETVGGSGSGTTATNNATQPAPASIRSDGGILRFPLSPEALLSLRFRPLADQQRNRVLRYIKELFAVSTELLSECILARKGDPSLGENSSSTSTSLLDVLLRSLLHDAVYMIPCLVDPTGSGEFLTMMTGFEEVLTDCTMWLITREQLREVGRSTSRNANADNNNNIDDGDGDGAHRTSSGMDALQNQLNVLRQALLYSEGWVAVYMASISFSAVTTSSSAASAGSTKSNNDTSASSSISKKSTTSVAEGSGGGLVDVPPPPAVASLLRGGRHKQYITPWTASRFAAMKREPLDQIGGEEVDDVMALLIQNILRFSNATTTAPSLRHDDAANIAIAAVQPTPPPSNEEVLALNKTLRSTRHQLMQLKSQGSPTKGGSASSPFSSAPSTPVVSSPPSAMVASPSSPPVATVSPLQLWIDRLTVLLEYQPLPIAELLPAVMQAARTMHPLIFGRNEGSSPSKKRDPRSGDNTSSPAEGKTTRAAETAAVTASGHLNHPWRSSRWHTLFNLWRIDRLHEVRSRVIHQDNAEKQYWKEVCDMVKGFVTASPSTSPKAIRNWSEQMESSISLRARGLKFILKQVSSLPPLQAWDVVSLYVRGKTCGDTASTLHPVTSGCDDIQSSLYELVRFVVQQSSQATTSCEHLHLSMDLLDAPWAPEDFIFLQSIDVPLHVMSQCSIFDDAEEAKLKPESEQEKARRHNHRDKNKNRSVLGGGVSGASPNPSEKQTELSEKERLLARSWTVLGNLVRRCCLTGLKESRTGSLTHQGCVLFLWQFLSCVEAEMSRCHRATEGTEFTPSDRALDQIGSLCSILCSMLHCLPSGYNMVLGRCPQVPRIVAVLAGLVAQTAPTRGVAFAELALQSLLHLLPRISPLASNLDAEFEELLKKSKLGGSTKSTSASYSTSAISSAVIFLANVAKGVGSSPQQEGIMSGSALLAIKTLRKLLLHCPLWQPHVKLLIELASPLSECNTTTATPSSSGSSENDEQNRDLMLAVLILSGPVAEVPTKVGTVMHQTLDGDPTRVRAVVVIDPAPGGVANVVDADLKDLTEESETPFDALQTPNETLVPLSEVERSLLPFLIRHVEDMLRCWVGLNRCFTLAATAAMLLRLLVRFTRDTPTCIELLGSGVLRRVQEKVAKLLSLSPIPLRFLREQLGVFLLQHIKNLRNMSATGSVTPAAKFLAQLEAHSQSDDDRMTGVIYPSLRPPAAGPALHTASHLYFRSAPLPNEMSRVAFNVPPNTPLPNGPDGFSIEAHLLLRDESSYDLGESLVPPSRWGKPKVNHTIASLRDEDGVEIVRFSIVNNGSVEFGSPLEPSSVARADLRSRDFGNWLYLVGVYDIERGWCIFRDGNLWATGRGAYSQAGGGTSGGGGGSSVSGGAAIASHRTQSLTSRYPKLANHDDDEDDDDEDEEDDDDDEFYDSEIESPQNPKDAITGDETAPQTKVKPVVQRVLTNLTIGAFLHTPLASLGGLSSDDSSHDDDTSSSTAGVVMATLRLWGGPLNAQYVKSIAEVLDSESVLPNVNPGDHVPALCFRFEEGTGTQTFNDDCTIRGDCTNTHWIPTGLPDISPETDVRGVDDIERDVNVADFTVPRKEWLAQAVALEATNLAFLGIQCSMSLSVLYARQAVLNGVQLTQHPSFGVVSNLDPGSVFSQLFDMSRGKETLLVPQQLANLVRYNELPTVDETAMDALVSFVKSYISSGAAVPSRQNEFYRLVAESKELLGEHHEVFSVDIPHSSYSSSEPTLFPLFVTGGGSFTIAFDGSRSMDYLYVFADRLQKVHIAKYPDPQALWPDLDLTHNMWFYIKPSSAGNRNTNGRFFIKVASSRFFVGMRLLSMLLDHAADTEQTGQGSSLLPAFLSQTMVTTLTAVIHHETGLRRLLAIRLLTKLLTTWAKFPNVQRCDQSPLALPLERFVSYVTLLAKKELEGGTVAPSQNCFSRLVQQVSELIMSTKIAELAWSNTTREESLIARGRRLHDLYQAGMATTSPPAYLPEIGRLGSAQPEIFSPVQLQRVTSSGPGPLWRERGKGVWFCSCDRGWYTLRGSHGVNRGKWYFEMRLPHQSSVSCVGVVTNLFKCPDMPQMGAANLLGQCSQSWGFDGSRLCKLHNGIRTDFHAKYKWKLNDVIGILLDLEEGSLSCTVNGKLVAEMRDTISSIHSATRPTYFPAVSFNPSGADINFGAAPFTYDVPHGFLPWDYRGTKHSSIFKVAESLLLIDSAAALKAGQPLPSVFDGLEKQRYANVEGRHGPEEGGFALVDGRLKIEKLIVRSIGSLSTVKCNIRVSSGKWYYEVFLHSDGLMQIGWCTESFVPDSVRSKGCGDDANSWAIDGCRMLARHNKQQRSLGRHPWREGDTLGCLVDCDTGTLGFTINGQTLRELHSESGRGLFSGVKCTDGLSPCLTVDPDNALQIILSEDEMFYLPHGYQPLGAANPLRYALEEQMLSFSRMPPTRLCESEGSTPTTPSTAGSDDATPVVATSRSVSPERPPPDPTAPLLFEHQEEKATRSNGFDRFRRSTFQSDVQLVSSIAQASDQYTVVVNYWKQLIEKHFYDLSQQNVQRSEDVGTPETPLTASDMHKRVVLLFRYARLVQEVLPLVATMPSDFGDGILGPVGQAVWDTKAILLTFLPYQHMKDWLQRTNGSGESVKLTLNRRKSDIPVFEQIFGLISDRSSSMFCTAKKLWSVAFVGEGADDVGGPYRESIAQLCSEVMSTALPLFIPSANQKNNIGQCRDRFIPAPVRLPPFSSARAKRLSMYTFFGKVMGGCLRGGEPMALYLPAYAWKVLVGETPTVPSDLKLIDESLFNTMDYLLTQLEGTAFDNDQLADLFSGTFTTVESDGEEVELFPLGSRYDVTVTNLRSYVQMNLRHRLVVEPMEALQALAKGFHKVVPAHSLWLTRWEDLERHVCGRPDFDVEELRASVRFEGLVPLDRRVRFLWQLLSEFSRHERALFMRFVSGRERLPANVRLKLMPAVFSDDSDDQHLPGASTCFFWLSLPDYSSVDVMREKLLYAIYHCIDIDADFRVRDTEDGDGVASPQVATAQDDDEGEFEDYSHLL